MSVKWLLVWKFIYFVYILFTDEESAAALSTIHKSFDCKEVFYFLKVCFNVILLLLLSNTLKVYIHVLFLCEGNLICN